ncbi:MAG: hypothetical protein KW802_04660 [Candidatus Doudnabacteria bacterium]|nr:hypothetical protein [Candidatus Doudnabacteria bacterium]
MATDTNVAAQVLPNLRSMEQSILEKLLPTLKDQNLKFVFRSDTTEFVAIRPEEQAFLPLLPGLPKCAPGKQLADAIKGEIERRDQAKAAIRSLLQKMGLQVTKEAVNDIWVRSENGGQEPRSPQDHTAKPPIRVEDTRPVRIDRSTVGNTPLLTSAR